VTSYIPRWSPIQVLTQHGQESNSQPVDYKSVALTTTPPSHHGFSALTVGRQTCGLYKDTSALQAFGIEDIVMVVYAIGWGYTDTA